MERSLVTRILKGVVVSILFGACTLVQAQVSDFGNARSLQGFPINPATPATGQCLTVVSGQWRGAACGSGSGLTTEYQTVTFSATPTFTVTSGTSIENFLITLTGNVTGSTLDLTGAVAGQDVTFNICQDSSGSHTFVWPSNVTGNGVVSGTASTCSKQLFRFDGTNAIAVGPLFGTGAGSLVNLMGSISGSSSVKASATGGGVATLPAGAGTLLYTTGNAATATALAANGTNCSAGSYPLGVDASGNSKNCTAAENPLTFNAPLTRSTNAISCATCATKSGTLTSTNVLIGDGTNVTASGVTVDGSNNVSTPGNLTVGAGSGVTSTVAYKGGTSGNTVTTTVSATTAVATLTFPGVTGTVAATTGTLTNGNCAQFDSSGRLVDAGAACGTGGGGWGAWTAVSYQNSWANFGSGQQVVQYRKDAAGDVVCVRGLATSGTLTGNTVVFNLPTGFRPPANGNKFPLATDAPITNIPNITIESSGDAKINSATSTGYYGFNFCFSTVP